MSFCFFENFTNILLVFPFILKNVNQKVRCDPSISVEHLSKEH